MAAGGIAAAIGECAERGENPDELIVYAALGKAARNWASHKAIVETLLRMDEDQTLIIQSGKPIGLLKTHAKAPLVIMANCNIVGQWAKAEVFYELEKKGLICWGGLTAGPGNISAAVASFRAPMRFSCALPRTVSAAIWPEGSF